MYLLFCLPTRVPPSPSLCPAPGVSALKSRSWGATPVVSQYGPFCFGLAFTCKLGSYHTSSQHPGVAYSVIPALYPHFHSHNKATGARAGGLRELLLRGSAVTQESGTQSVPSAAAHSFFSSPAHTLCRPHRATGISPASQLDSLQQGAVEGQHPGAVGGGNVHRDGS